MRKAIVALLAVVVITLAVAGQASAEQVEPLDRGCSDVILPCSDEFVFIGTKLTINPDYDYSEDDEVPKRTNPSDFTFWRCPGRSGADLNFPESPNECTLIGNAANGYVVQESDLGKQIFAARGCKEGTFEPIDPDAVDSSSCIVDEGEQIPNSPIAPTRPVVKEIWSYLPIMVSVPSAYRLAPWEYGYEEDFQPVYYFLWINGKIRASCKDKVRQTGVYLGCPYSNSKFVALPKFAGKTARVEACSLNRYEDSVTGKNPYFIRKRHCAPLTKPIRVRKTKSFGGEFIPPSGWRESKDPGVTIPLSGSRTVKADMDYVGLNVALISDRAGTAAVTVRIPGKTARRYGVGRRDITLGSKRVALEADADPVVRRFRAPSSISRRLRFAVERKRGYYPPEIPVRVSVELG